MTFVSSKNHRSFLTSHPCLLSLLTVGREPSLIWRKSRTLYYQGQRQYLSGDDTSSNSNNNYFSSHSNNASKPSNSATLHHALLVNYRSSPSPDRRNISNVHPRHHPNLQHHPCPIFALSHRLLAFSSPEPSYSYAHAHTNTGSPSTSPLVTVPSPAGAGPLGLGLTTQAEIGRAALKIGGSVLNGMRTLGGIALSAAKSRVVSAGSGSSSRHATGELSGGVVRSFSRSAPSEGVVGEREEEPRRERRYLSTSSGLSASPRAAGAGASHALAGVQAPEGVG
jgi:hypothetical protein